MKVINYFESDNQKHWLEEIGKSDWSAGKYLYEILSENKLEELVGENAKVLMLVDEDKLISFCTFAKYDEIQPTELTPWIGFVYTFPEYRGNHYFGLIADEAEKLAREISASKIHISTDAVGLYEKYGYEFYQIMKNIHGEDCRIYVKRI